QTWCCPLSKTCTVMLGGGVGIAGGYGRTKEIRCFENCCGGGLGSVRGYESGTRGPKVDDEYGEEVSSGGNKKANVSAGLLCPM
ncbi:outer membrane protein assembly factor BamA, partial [Neisseria meningitidis]|uniref:BamA/TamA family outer membrane protein n=1 Tax=Neisseria meningitidis TaxID=487 RepID=UPI000CBC6BC5